MYMLGPSLIIRSICAHKDFTELRFTRSLWMSQPWELMRRQEGEKSFDYTKHILKKKNMIEKVVKETGTDVVSGFTDGSCHGGDSICI